MKIVLFCENRYAIDILMPLYEEANKQKRHSVLWYICTKKITKYTLPEDAVWTDSMQAVYDFSPDAIYVPGNMVPYYLPGVKIQVFHGYAAEKKDQFRIRNYFDMYLTQGPFFTGTFDKLAAKYKDFEVRETGWTKQDWIAKHIHDYDEYKESLLKKYGKKRIMLYAPTFSPRLTSLPCMMEALGRLLDDNDDLLLVMKFHPLTAAEWQEQYRAWASQRQDCIYVEATENVTTYQMISDVMVSDTSSTVYEFLLLDRPVITVRSIARDIYWMNINDENELTEAYRSTVKDGKWDTARKWIIDNYDPHLDGECCKRMIEAAEDFIRRNGVPRQRKLNLWRKYTSIKKFGRIKR